MLEGDRTTSGRRGQLWVNIGACGWLTGAVRENRGRELRDETVSKLTSGSISGEYFHAQAQVHSSYSIATSLDVTHCKDVIALFTIAFINKGQVWVLGSSGSTSPTEEAKRRIKGQHNLVSDVRIVVPENSRYHWRLQRVTL